MFQSEQAFYGHYGPRLVVDNNLPLQLSLWERSMGGGASKSIEKQIFLDCEIEWTLDNDKQLNWIQEYLYWHEEMLIQYPDTQLLLENNDDAPKLAIMYMDSCT